MNIPFSSTCLLNFKFDNIFSVWHTIYYFLIILLFPHNKSNTLSVCNMYAYEHYYNRGERLYGTIHDFHTYFFLKLYILSFQNVFFFSYKEVDNRIFNLKRTIKQTINYVTKVESVLNYKNTYFW